MGDVRIGGKAQQRGKQEIDSEKEKTLGQRGARCQEVRNENHKVTHKDVGNNEEDKGEHDG